MLLESPELTPDPDPFEQIYQSACRVCDNNLYFQPDVVLALMHSSWAPVFAAQTLWAATQPAPFPPSVRSNLGREKVKLFQQEARLEPGMFSGAYSDNITIGRFLAWLAGRADWHEQLRRQVNEATNSRISHLTIISHLLTRPRLTGGRQSAWSFASPSSM